MPAGNFCPQCSAAVPEGAAPGVCPRCGAALPGAAAPSPAFVRAVHEAIHRAGGVNMHSMRAISALAAQHQQSADQMRAALNPSASRPAPDSAAAPQAPPPPRSQPHPDAEAQAQLAAAMSVLQRQLQGRTITIATRQKIIVNALKRVDLPRVTVEHAVDAALVAGQVRVLSEAAAAALIEQLARDAMGGLTFLSPEDTDRLTAAGADLGISPEGVNALIGQAQGRNSEAVAAGRRRRRWFIVGNIVFLVVVSTLLVLLLNRSGPTPPPAATKTGAPTAAPVSTTQPQTQSATTGSVAGPGAAPVAMNSQPPVDPLASAPAQPGVPRTAKSARQPDPRLPRIRDLAKPLLSAAVSTERIDLLQQAVDLCHLATLACAVAQGERGHASFDRLVDHPPARLDPKANPAAAAGASSVAPRTLKLQAVRLAQATLDDRKPATATDRTLLIEQLAASSAENVAAYAEPVARYALTAPRSEYQQTRPALARLGQVPYVAQALADVAGDMRGISRDRAVALAADILGPTIKLPNEWAPQFIALMTDHAIATLQTLERPQNLGNPADDARQQFTDFYRQQATVLGIDTSADAPGLSAVHWMQAMSDQLVARLKQADSAPGVPQRLEVIAEQRRLVDYLAENDLQKTVGMQRHWLRLLALDVAARSPGSASQAAAIISELESADAASTDVLQQLIHAERAATRLWLLLAEAR